ncbi:MAG: porphobilinogen synthase [Pseudomonadota bacterium]|nr:porphobilinogen synthase [Pseudomonadota bacterium]
MFPTTRLRRLRMNPVLRDMVRSVRLDAADLIAPLFVDEGLTTPEPITTIPGQMRHSPDSLIEACRDLHNKGVRAVILFGIPSRRDARGSGAYAEDGIVQQAIRKIKAVLPDLLVIGDVCLCAYTDHGHCGLVEKGRIHNDSTLALLAKTAVSQARAGVDMIAPSDMMDGRVAVIRSALDAAGFSDLPIMSYAAKYDSAFYGPFRDAVGSSPSFGGRASYQMDPAAGIGQAMAEIAADLEEGADMVMIKPALTCLDVIAAAKARFDAPIVAYQVSGEYAMIKSAASIGCFDEKRAVVESLTAIKRAGADLILTYFASDVADWGME